MRYDTEIIPGCWVWLGATRKNGAWNRFPAVGRKRAARVIWEEMVGPVAKGSRLVRQCRVPLCVNPEHHKVSDPAQAAEDIREQYTAGRSVKELAELFGYSARSVERILGEHLKRASKRTWDPRALERATALLKEGLPDRWVAEDVAMPIDMVRDLRAKLRIQSGEWVRVQLSVRHNTALRALHEMFNPGPGVSQ